MLFIRTVHSILRYGVQWALCSFLLSGSAHAWQPPASERLYVQRFATRTGAGKLQQDVVEELRKTKSVVLVSQESDANLILGGGGEIWIRGYRSLNPRSGRLPSDGTPVYDGFLSVELRNPHGITLWSYLVTPGTASPDISKDLSRQIAKHLVEALKEDITPDATTPQPPVETVLSGAGATFPFPVYEKWFANYHRENPGVQINYDAVGSEAGIRRLLAGTVDFGASDNPQVFRELAPADESKYLLFPSVVGAVAPIVNLPGVPQEISFTPEALAGIFLGKITKWNDPILARANRHLHLPDLDIVVVHRADGSGTSYAWSDYLSHVSPEWKTKVGAGLAPSWPTGRGATGSDGVAGLVKELGGSIGYVEFVYALQHRLSYGKVQNRNGEFVAAGLESIAAALSHSNPVDAAFKTSIVDAPGAGSYPIASFTWLVVPTHLADERKRAALTHFLHWMLGSGQRQAAALGYLALPKQIVSREGTTIAAIQ